MAGATLIALVNGDEQISLNLSNYTQGEPTPGYHLVTYQANPAPAELARNSSLYVDGNTPVYSKAGNTVETIVLNIRGADAAAAYDYLRALQRWAYWVRDYHAAPNSRWPSYISYSPWGVSGRYYAVLINAQVNESDQSGRADADKGWIKRVTITIERESFWRQQPPTSAAFGTPYNFVSGGTTAAYASPRWWGVLPFNGLAGGLTVPAGDVPALVKFTVTPRGGFKLARFVAGYISQRRNAALGWTIPTTPNVIEAEAGTSFSGSTAPVVVTTASPYAGVSINTVMRTSANASFVLRFAVAAPLGTYSWRLFARMRLLAGAGGTSVKVQAYSDQTGPFGAPVYVNSTPFGDWFMYDLGVMVPPVKVSEWANTPASGGLPIGVRTQHVTGTEALDVDCFILIPTDEYYVDMTCTETTSTATPAMALNNIMVPPITTGQVNGALNIPPGKGILYYLAGWSSFENSWDPGGPTPVMTLGLNYSERYGSIKGT